MQEEREEEGVSSEGKEKETVSSQISHVGKESEKKKKKEEKDKETSSAEEVCNLESCLRRGKKK